MKLQFQADRYGPFSPRLNHLLNALDGSYLRSDKRIADCGPMDTIAFTDGKADIVAAYLRSGQGKVYAAVLEETDALIDGFQSPLGMELLATVDWLIRRENCPNSVQELRSALERWPGGADAGQRKQRLFTDRLLAQASARLCNPNETDSTCSNEDVGGPISARNGRGRPRYDLDRERQE
ncbi:MAG TPA: hypothetical protein VIS96_00930 [Terrimicrobiaceae bacterium]